MNSYYSRRNNMRSNSRLVLTAQLLLAIGLLLFECSVSEASDLTAVNESRGKLQITCVY